VIPRMRCNTARARRPHERKPFTRRAFRSLGVLTRLFRSPRVKYPPLPRTLEGPAGPVTVVRKSPIVCDGVACWGLWDEATRTITIDHTATMRHQWKTYFHEAAHVALDDSGLSNGLSNELVEALCDALAAARLRERFG
jgi:hypothetical protein